MTRDAPRIALVLAGGNALGAYHAGVYEALHEAGEHPSWISATSIGAITAALIAGNPPATRLDRLEAFWRRAASPPGPVPAAWARPAQLMGALQARLLGRPGLFHTRIPGFGGLRGLGLYDAGPMRRALVELVDFDRLNGGEIRLSVLALDLASGEEVVFEAGADRIGPDHLMASAALIPISRRCRWAIACWSMAGSRRTCRSMPCSTRPRAGPSSATPPTSSARRPHPRWISRARRAAERPQFRLAIRPLAARGAAHRRVAPGGGGAGLGACPPHLPFRPWRARRVRHERVGLLRRRAHPPLEGGPRRRGARHRGATQGRVRPAGPRRPRGRVGRRRQVRRRSAGAAGRTAIWPRSAAIRLATSSAVGAGRRSAPRSP